MKNLKTIIIFITSAVLFTGCGYTIEKYDSDGDNIAYLSKLDSKPIRVGKFTSFEPGYNNIACRAAGGVTAPNEQPFDQYIRDALIKELKTAGKYSETANIEISGHLDKIDFSSAIGGGDWNIKMTFTEKNTTPIVIETTYNFSSHFVADAACTKVANAFSPAVSQLLEKLYQDPKFIKLVKP